ncbi:SMP-30/gluconolactonase/LRE family protein [Chitinophaga caseinilytica]|uniref:SMP-30/gluconolactonase/LRE family protein n=1 Tax=Chitinophaga caseinilytica TaxID=2267521 RepID=UPI003C2CC8AB
MLKTFSRYLLAAAVLLTACSKDKEQHEAGVPMTISGFIPQTGGHGTSILISGSNFSNDSNEVEVTINGKKLAIVGCNTRQIMAIVPKRCGSGAVSVKIGGKEVASSGEFDYIFTRTVTTFAGSGVAGYLNAKGEDAMFNFGGTDWQRGSGIVTDKDGNVYVTDVGNTCIRKIDPSGRVSTFAGTNSPGDANGTGTEARFLLPYGLAIDKDGNLYTADPSTWKIKKISPQGVVTDYHGASHEPWHVTVNKATNEVFYSSTGAGGVYRIKPGGGEETVVSDMLWAAGIGFDKDGNLYMSGSGHNAIFKYAKDTWARTVVAGKLAADGSAAPAGYRNGTAEEAQFSLPWALCVDDEGNIYVAGNGSWNGGSGNADQSIRYIDGRTGRVSTYAGSNAYGYANALGEAAKFAGAQGITTDNNGTSYVLDKNNNRVRKIVSE